MAGISNLGTTYLLPNYTGELIALTPSDTPFLSAIGGLNAGGMQTESTEFEWQSYDLRAASQNTRLEGADAPTAEERVRANITNVCQIHQEAISLSYTKQAAIQQKAGTNNADRNPVSNELDWQTEQMLKQIARDVEWSFLNGTYQKPVDNTTARKTRGLRAAITSNVMAYASADLPSVTFTDSGDVVNSTAHGLADGDQVQFSVVTTTTGISTFTPYYVVNKATNTFQVSLAKGGAPIALTTNGSGTGQKLAPTSKDVIDGILQVVYDAGGIVESSTATLIVNAALKRGISKAYLTAGNYQESSRNVAGVAVTTIETDFGTLNLMLNRYMPATELVVCSLEQCAPVFLEVPGKGHMFVEPLARTGAQDKAQIYGEVGLKYGNEKSHGKVTGLGYAA